MWSLWGQVVGGKEMVATSPLRVIWTDDNFSTFQSAAIPGLGGPPGYVGGAEAHLAQVSPTRLVIAIRGGMNESLPFPVGSTACGCLNCSCLTSAYSDTSGSTWSSAAANPTMLEPGCMSALLRATDGCIYLSGPGTRYSHE